VTRKKILLRSLGSVMFIAGSLVWAVTFAALRMNAADFFYLTRFSWGLLVLAVVGLAVAAGGVMVFQAGGRMEEATALSLLSAGTITLADRHAGGGR
jgi:hypothetical protein